MSGHCCWRFNGDSRCWSHVGGHCGAFHITARLAPLRLCGHSGRQQQPSKRHSSLAFAATVVVAMFSHACLGHISHDGRSVSETSDGTRNGSGRRRRAWASSETEFFLPCAVLHCTFARADLLLAALAHAASNLHDPVAGPTCLLRPDSRRKLVWLDCVCYQRAATCPTLRSAGFCVVHVSSRLRNCFMAYSLTWFVSSSFRSGLTRTR